MNTKNAPGRDLQGEDENARRAAASTMGKARTDRKLNALAENRAKFTGHSEETRAKLRMAQAVRREREKQERAALGIVEPVKETKKPGRPAKVRPDVETVPRPRGRPKKQTGQNITISAGTPETGAQGQESLLQEGNEAQ